MLEELAATEGPVEVRYGSGGRTVTKAVPAPLGNGTGPGTFELEPEASGGIMLKWREQGADTLFAAHQASDGMLRAMALVALLCQPAEWLPGVVVIDEPELGLHPRLTGLKSIFDGGRLAIVQRTGYENSSRSHFTGFDIWGTANPANAISVAAPRK